MKASGAETTTERGPDKPGIASLLPERSTNRVNYKDLAFRKYPPRWAHCSFGINDVLPI
jgi:hypothetical protein